MVGANKISEFAKALEENCHQGDYETAWNGAERLLHMLQECADNIRTYLGVETDTAGRDNFRGKDETRPCRVSCRRLQTILTWKNC